MGLTLEQQKATALAAARKRAKEKGIVQLKGSVTPQAERPAEGSSNIEDQRPKPEPTIVDAGQTWVNGFINGIPVVGPILQRTSDAVVSKVGSMVIGEDQEAIQKGIEERRQDRAEALPLTSASGNLTGAITSLGAAGATKVGAEALGMAGKFIPRVVKSGVSSGAISTADSMVRGEDLPDALAHGAVDAGIGAAIPIAGDAIATAVKAGARTIAPVINAAMNPTDEAARRVGAVVARDRTSAPTQVMSSADEQVAREAKVPLINVDRGGETTRALARSAANQSPEARATIQKTAQDRFEGQGGRAVEFVRKITGGQVDDLRYHQAVRKAADAVNDPAYKKAYSSPAAQQVWTPKIQELMQSDTFLQAVRNAEKRGSDIAAAKGFPKVVNPFVFAADGSVSLKPGVTPNLQFWDTVKRNLDSEIGVAQRAGDNTRAGDLLDLKRKLVDGLDTIVPEYRQARQGAAFFFGADDALEAGKKFATTPKLIPEARQAYQKFNATERQAFATGYASELIDKIKTVRDRSNVVDQVFGNPASREMIDLALGSGNAKRLEAYVRVEDLADRLRGAMGNSTTARQLVELGIGAGGGLALTGGDWKGALTGAALAKGGRYLGERVDGKVMQEIARMLTADDPAMLQKAVARATMDSKAMEALKALGKLLSAPVRGSVVAPEQPKPGSAAMPPVAAPGSGVPTTPPG